MGLTLNVAMFSAFGLIPIALALMLFYTYPAGVVVVDVAMGHERITASRLVALGLSTLGVVLVLVGGLDPAAGVPVAPLGIVLGLAAAAAQVVFVTISRHGYRSVPADGATLVNLSVSLVGGAVIALVIGQGDGLAAPLRSRLYRGPCCCSPAPWQPGCRRSCFSRPSGSSAAHGRGS